MFMFICIRLISSIHLNQLFSFVAASFDLGILERGIFICSTLVSSYLFRVWSFHVQRACFGQWILERGIFICITLISSFVAASFDLGLKERVMTSAACLFWLMARLDYCRFHRNRCASNGSSGLHRTTFQPFSSHRINTSSFILWLDSR